MSTRLLCPWNSPGKELEWVAISFSKGSSQPRDQTQVCIVGRFFIVWATRDSPCSKFPTNSDILIFLFHHIEVYPPSRGLYSFLMWPLNGSISLLRPYFKCQILLSWLLTELYTLYLFPVMISCHVFFSDNYNYQTFCCSFFIFSFLPTTM